MARIKIELSNEDLETLKRGGFIEVETIGNTPKIIISAEPMFVFKDNYSEPTFPKPFEGLPIRRCSLEPIIPKKDLNELLEKTAPCTSDKKLSELKEKWFSPSEAGREFSTAFSDGIRKGLETPITTEIIDDRVKALINDIKIDLDINPKEPYEFVGRIGGHPLTQYRKR